ARALEFQLSQDAESTVWTDGVFEPSVGTLESLANALDRFDFAALVLTPDDLVVSRDSSCLAPRDNMMFELGLFMGRLGRSRTFVVASQDSRLRLPSDLAGVTLIRFDPDRRDGNTRAALGPAATLIRQAIRDLGYTDTREFRRLSSATRDMESISGHAEKLLHPLAKSRIVELRAVTHRFQGILPQETMREVEQDIIELQEACNGFRDGRSSTEEEEEAANTADRADGNRKQRGSRRSSA
ncbi:MAG TPA: TIR domain-containing protein, partial [Thermoanaerobaculia bacterium]|nr:TIR domain-containing protein [Thermoanaerobaculia bacterium]